MNFTVGLISSVKSKKVTYHRTFIAFLFIIFSLQFPWFAKGYGDGEVRQ
jgi:hypothetical protein